MSNINPLSTGSQSKQVPYACAGPEQQNNRTTEQQVAAGPLKE
nr:hypothetical protein [Endozoicomonas sp.]